MFKKKINIDTILITIKIYDYFIEFGMDNDIFVKYEFLMPKKKRTIILLV